jgi:O-acetyl-ADP-ribose deacetylase
VSTTRASGVTIELTDGDITAQPDVEAIVNAANARLMPGGGVAGAIHRAAGPGLAEECRPLAPVNPGQSVITTGHGLPNRWVIHCLGPVYGVDEPAADLLAACYSGALALAEEHHLASVAFPALSTGAFGYPVVEASEVALHTVVEAAPRLNHVALVRFVLFGGDSLAVHRETLDRLVASPGGSQPPGGSPGGAA